MLRDEIFVVTGRKNKPIVFLPLRGVVFYTNDAGIRIIDELIGKRDSKWEQFLEYFPQIDRRRLMNVQFKTKRLPAPFDDFSPTYLTLFPTLNCNLDCVYCYAFGGERDVDMKWEVAKTAIDYVLGNAKHKGEPKSFIEFHGGGEPTYHWSLMQKSADYYLKKANKMGIEVNVKLVTNGYLSSKQVEWVKNYINVLCISFDGPEEIQNKQRPTKVGGPSFERVLRVSKELQKGGMHFVIRVTITGESVARLPEIVKFFCTHFNNFSLDIEPLRECGRCKSSGYTTPSIKDFTNYFLLADKVANKYSKSLFFSGFNLKKLRRVFCQVATPHFIVTPSGSVTSCYEVVSPEDDLSGVIHYGGYDFSEGRFVFDKEKIAKLRSLTTVNHSSCQKCFCRYHCAGNCLIKRADEKTLKIIENDDRCQMTKIIAEKTLRKILEERR